MLISQYIQRIYHEPHEHHELLALVLSLFVWFVVEI
jgi:hypothetical protein